ncbi:hypothetical protein A1YS_00776 [Escherichia coli KTE141]|nr:hypothetical protein A13K_00743 [Escherichia coli KTE187]ELG80618.1 hypothetical protein A1YS_00776 [Escherichia coli KTE141]ELJ96824.1 hypothetical protein WI1_00245 [Escherichia coli KTE97]
MKQSSNVPFPIRRAPISVIFAIRKRQKSAKLMIFSRRQIVIYTTSIRAYSSKIMSISANTLILRPPHSLGLKSLTVHRCRHIKCISTCHTSPHQLPFMERRRSRRNTRHRLGGTGGVHQHKTGVILRFRPHTLAFFIQRQYIASG